MACVSVAAAMPASNTGGHSLAPGGGSERVLRVRVTGFGRRLLAAFGAVGLQLVDRRDDGEWAVLLLAARR